MSTIACCDRKKRYQDTARPQGLNGVDFINVNYRNRRLYVHLFEAATVEPAWVSVVDVRRNKRLPTNLVSGSNTNVLILEYTKTDEAPREGRTYRFALHFVENEMATDDPPVGFDPRFSQIEFLYNETLASEVDFAQRASIASSIFPRPEINYLAKDYASFRQLILDRLAKTMPHWQETHAADLGMTLVELLAYAGDRLSYYQDAVATEGYLGTARRRESVRRHARLVDYHMHEGCNARALLQIQVAGDLGLAPEDIFFLTKIPAAFQITGVVHDATDLPDELYQHVVCFEPVLPPEGSWRLTSDDVKDVQALVSLVMALEPSEVNAAIEPTELELTKFDAAISSARMAADVPRRVSAQEIDKTVRAANRLLEQGQFPAGFSALHPHRVRRTWHLPLRYRNRALLDALLADYISSARIDRLVRLYQAHNEIDLYTWDEQECWIPKGATSATLVDAWEPPPAPCGGRPTPHCDNAPAGESGQRSQLSQLSAGDFLLLEERIGPRTGEEADANENHRQFVRLTKVRFSHDPAHDIHEDGPYAGRWKVPLVEIEWDPEDKLRFPLCVSSRKQPESGCGLAERVSVARGNVVPIDQGRKLDRREIGVARSQLQQTDCGDGWEDAAIVEVHEAFRPTIVGANLTYADPLDPRVSATQFDASQPRRASAQISLIGIPGLPGNTTVRLQPENLDDREPAAFVRLWRALSDAERHVLEDEVEAEEACELHRLTREDLPPERLRQLIASLREALTWHARRDLLSSGSRDRHFVVENDTQRSAHLRFGDGQHGRRPGGGTRFHATLRSGNGVRGNVGAESIENVVFRRNLRLGITSLSNPLPAGGAVDAESIEEVKLYAPHAWLIDQPRASLAEDYVRLAREKFASRIQNARAVINWVGAYWLVELVIDPLAAEPQRRQLEGEVEAYLSRYRRIGHRVAVVTGRRVPIALGMTVCVAGDDRPEDVRAELMTRFSNRSLPDGTRGFFHPDRLTFGQPIYSSRVIEEAAQVPGVTDVRIDFLDRCEDMPCQPVELTSNHACNEETPTQWKSRVIEIGDLEIAQLDNSGSRANGLLCLNMGVTP